MPSKDDKGHKTSTVKGHTPSINERIEAFQKQASTKSNTASKDLILDVMEITKGIFNKSMRNLLGGNRSKKSFYSDNFFPEINRTTLFLSGGIDENFAEEWSKLCRADLIYSARGKPLDLIASTGEVIEMNNPLLDKSAPKPILLHDKSKGPLSANIGHVKVLLKGRVPKEVPGKKDIYTIPYDKVTLHLTHEMQDLQYIQTQIQAKPPGYIVLECNSNAEPPYFIIQDQENAQFLIELADFSEKRMLRTSAEKTKSLFSSPQMTNEASRSLVNILQTDPTKKIASEKTPFEKFIADNQKVWSLNISRTVKLYNRVKNAMGVWETDRRPDIACDVNGNPIKGDIDLQAALVSIDIPPEALRLIDNTPGPLLENFNTLLEKLTEQHKRRESNTENLSRVINILKLAIIKLDEYSKNHPRDKPSAMIEAMGNINVLNAAMVLGLDSAILHGDEGTSPLWPESFILVQTPNPLDTKNYINTYSEFEYYKLLLSNNAILENKTITINPCWLVKDTDNRWRQKKNRTRTTR